MANQKKLQIFISSTFTDLQDERQAAVEAILKAGHIPAGMELFTASNKSQWDIITRWIDESDVYMLILGGRYGSIEPDSGKSYTHLEYEYAHSKGKPLFAVIIEDHALDSRRAKDIEKDNPEKLSAFRESVLSYMSSFFTDKKDIKLAVHESLGKITQEHELTGWVKGSEQNDNLAKELVTLNDEIRILREENSKFKSKQVQRSPIIELIINDSETLEIHHKINTSEFYQKREPIIEIPNHLKEYINDEDIKKYNNMLLAIDESTIQNYNEIIARKFNFLELQNNLKLSLYNFGNLKASNIHVYIKFPDYVYIFEDKDEVKKAIEQMDSLASKVIPEPFSNPLIDAEKKFNANSVLGNALAEYLAVTAQTLGANKYISPISQAHHFANFEPFDKENNISVLNNEIIIKKASLLHGLEKIYDNYLLVPVKKGEGIIEINIYCEEFLECKKYKIPLIVS